MRKDNGFTLIEVMVAFAIVSVSFVLIMQLFAGGLRAGRTSSDYTKAVVHAKDKMEELSDNPEGNSGEFDDGFRWQTEVQDHTETEESLYVLKKIKVIIEWSDGNRQRSIEMVSLKAVDSEASL